MLIVSFLLYSDIGIVTSMKVNHKPADFADLKKQFQILCRNIMYLS